MLIFNSFTFFWWNWFLEEGISTNLKSLVNHLENLDRLKLLKEAYAPTACDKEIFADCWFKLQNVFDVKLNISFNFWFYQIILVIVELQSIINREVYSSIAFELVSISKCHIENDPSPSST